MSAFLARETEKNSDAEIELVKQTVKQNTQSQDAYPEDEHSFLLWFQIRFTKEATTTHNVIGRAAMIVVARLRIVSAALFVVPFNAAVGVINISVWVAKSLDRYSEPM
jgi:hypothetical protein